MCYNKSTENTVPCKTSIATKEKLGNHNISIAYKVSTFEELIQKSKMFVDNSLLILEILQNPSHRVYHWIGPSTWGKTINLDMVKTFFEIQVDQHGDKISPKESAKNYKLFAKGEIVLDDGHVQKLLTPLLISKQRSAMEEYHSQVPVMLVNFEHSVGENATIIKQKIRSAISRAFDRHKYMIHVLHEKCEKHRKSSKWCKNLNQFNEYLYKEEWKDMENSLVFLREVLESHFDRKPIILLDDFDTPVFNYLRNDAFSDSDDWKQILEFMEELMLITFDERQELTFGIVTGSFKLPYREPSKKCYLGQKTEPLHEYFGFSEAIVDSIFDRHRTLKRLSTQASRWYSGWKSIISKQTFYNPACIAGFLTGQQITVYSKETTTRDYIQKVLTAYPHIRHTVLRLLGKQDVQVHDDKGYYNFPGRFENLRNILRDTTQLSSEQEITFYWYLLGEGYLTRIPNSGKAKLLNIEMFYCMSIRMISFYKQHFNIDEQLLENAASDLRIFTLGKPNTSAIELEKSLSLLYEDTFDQSFNIMNKHSILSVFYCATLRMQGETKFEIDVYYNKTFQPVIVKCYVDVVVIDNSTRQGIIIAIDYDKASARNACDFAHYQREIVLTHKYMRTLKMVGINISSNKTVHILQQSMVWWRSDEDYDTPF